MNTISNNNQNILDLYAVRKAQALSALKKFEMENQRKQQESDSIDISQQALQMLNSSVQAESNSSPLDSLVSAGTITQEQADAIESAFASRGIKKF